MTLLGLLTSLMITLPPPSPYKGAEAIERISALRHDGAQGLFVVAWKGAFYVPIYGPAERLGPAPFVVRSFDVQGEGASAVVTVVGSGKVCRGSVGAWTCEKTSKRPTTAVAQRWVSPATGRTYTLVDRNGGEVRVEKPGEPTQWWPYAIADAVELTGSVDAGGDILLVRAEGSVSILTGTTDSQLSIADDAQPIRAAVLDVPGTRLLYIDKDGKVRRVSIVMLAAGGSGPLRERLRTGDVDEDEGPSLQWLPTVMLRLGAIAPLSEAQSVGFALDIELGAEVFPGSKVSWGIRPFLGYQLETGPFHGHYATLGLGIAGYGKVFGGGVHVRGVLGERRDRFSGGVRSGVFGALLYSTVTLEASHQALWRPGGLDHDVRFTVGFDLIRLPLVVWLVGGLLGGG